MAITNQERLGKAMELLRGKRRAAEALAYNGLVQSWPEIARLACVGDRPRAAQGGLFGETEE